MKSFKLLSLLKSRILVDCKMILPISYLSTMPPLPGFSITPFVTQEDTIHTFLAFLQPLHRYKPPLCARIKIPIETGTQFDETAAQLEGFARPPRALIPLLASTFALPENSEHFRSWPKGLLAGRSPDEYCDNVADVDQRMAEFGILTFALPIVPDASWPSAPA